MTNNVVPFTGAVEGAVDEVVLRKVVSDAGHDISTIYNTRGSANFTQRLAGFNAAAEFAPWIALLDLDQAACAPDLIARLLPQPAQHMRFRIAVREIESWLLGDAERFSSFFSIALSRIPASPDGVADPKQTLVNLARHSRRRAIRDDLLPAQGSRRSVGPAYEARLIEFVLDEAGWRPAVAAVHSDSLRRCIASLA